MPIVLARLCPAFLVPAGLGLRGTAPLPGLPPACSSTCYLHPMLTPVFQKLERESGAVILSLVIPVLKSDDLVEECC